MKKILSLLMLLFVASSAFAQQKKIYVRVEFKGGSFASGSVSVAGVDLPEDIKYKNDETGEYNNRHESGLMNALDDLAKYGYVIEQVISPSQSVEVYLLSKEIENPAASNKALRGDVNEDGKVSISDATEVVDILLIEEGKK